MHKVVAVRWRALCLGVGTFTPAEPDDAEEPELTPFGALDYAATYTAELQTALAAAGYETELITDPARLAADELGEHVERYLTGGEVAVVHVLSHGERTQRGGVYVIGADAAKSKGTRVEDWGVTVSDDESAPVTLFLLDLCHAGDANRHWEPPESGAAERAWVIAAAGADQPAYAGRLTRAATAVITEITSGRADLAETLPFVPFDVLFERIRHQVQQLAADEDGYPQDPVCTPVMGAQPELPFFANPNYRPSPVAEAAAAVDAATAGFVDPALDAEHFRDRAAGRGPATARVAGGCFTGRGPQLRRLADWMDGHDDPVDRDDPDGARDGLVVVTGSPGVGKSALLGVLVCAAHPQLREVTRELWRHTATRPSLNPHLAAVHARQRSLEEITASLGRQLLGSDGALYPPFYPGRTTFPAGPRSPQELIAAIAARAVRPVIVLDALDEASGHQDALDEASGRQQILDQLLLPLAHARRPDGSPACRLLVGTRPWDEFAPLLAMADQSGKVIDLDAIPPAQRRHDLADYVGSLLELLPGFSGTAHRLGRLAFADALAATLVLNPQPARAPASGTAAGHGDAEVTRDGWTREETRWGEFLVAALYTHTTTLNHPDQLADRDAAARLGAAVPRTLPEVLELDLATRPRPPWQRPLLTALAHAIGAGIPRAVLPAMIAALADEPTSPSIEQVADELDQLRFYLRTGADTDGAALYRWFHQSLADHLRPSPVMAHDTAPETAHEVAAVRAAWRAAVRAAQRVVAGLLAAVPLDDRGRRRWDLAATYLLRHTIQHAARAGRVDELLTDPGFLIHADPTTLIPSLHLAAGPEARLAAAVYRASAGQHPDRTPSQRRDVLAIDAARYGASGLRDALCEVLPHPRWRPRWATGGQVNTALQATMTAHLHEAAGLACTVIDGRPTVVTAGGDGTVRLWDLATRTPIGEPLTGHTEPAKAVACTVLDGRPVAVTAGADRTVRLWDLATRTPIGEPLTGHTDIVYGVACAVVDGSPVAVTGSRDRTVRIWDLTTGTPIGDPLTGHTSIVYGVACTVVADHPVAVTASGDRTARMWNLSTGTPVGVLAGHASIVYAVACTDVDGRPVAVTTGADRTVQLWDLTSGMRMGGPLIGHTDTVWAVACTVLDGRPVAVTTGADDTVRIWNCVSAAPIRDPLTGHTRTANAVACTVLDGGPVAVTASWDNSVRVWGLNRQDPVGAPLAGHTSTVEAAACTVLNGRPVAVTADADATVRIWDLITGTPIGHPLTGHTLTVYAVACTVLDDRPVAVTTGADLTVRLWDLTTAAPIGNPLTGHTDTVWAVACTVLNGRPVAVTAGRDDTVRIWDLTTRAPIGEPLTGHTDAVEAVDCTIVDGRPVAVTASWDDTVRIWDLTTRTPIGEPLTGHTEHAKGVACTIVDGRPVAVTTGRDNTVRIWDLTTRTQIGNPLTGHTRVVHAVACTVLDGRPIAITAGRDATVRLWDLREPRELDRIDLPAPVRAIGVGEGNTIVAGFSWDVVVLEPASGVLR